MAQEEAASPTPKAKGKAAPKLAAKSKGKAKAKVGAKSAPKAKVKAKAKANEDAEAADRAEAGSEAVEEVKEEQEAKQEKRKSALRKRPASAVKEEAVREKMRKSKRPQRRPKARNLSQHRLLGPARLVSKSRRRLRARKLRPRSARLLGRILQAGFSLFELFGLFLAEASSLQSKKSQVRRSPTLTGSRTTASSASKWTDVRKSVFHGRCRLLFSTCQNTAEFGISYWLLIKLSKVDLHLASSLIGWRGCGQVSS